MNAVIDKIDAVSTNKLLSVEEKYRKNLQIISEDHCYVNLDSQN
jgi:hypothetical protein